MDFSEKTEFFRRIVELVSHMKILKIQDSCGNFHLAIFRKFLSIDLEFLEISMKIIETC